MESLPKLIIVELEEGYITAELITTPAVTHSGNIPSYIYSNRQMVPIFSYKQKEYYHTFNDILREL